MEVSKIHEENSQASENSSHKAKVTLARRLASPDKKTREKAISLLTVWLTSQDVVKEHELKKIWKGLFYCVWHADKLQVQIDLIERLASLLEKLELELALQFFKIFLFTMRREWAGIDRLRLDKFYLLLRRFLVHVFAVLEKQGWHIEWTTKFMNALEERAFLAKDKYTAQGISLHYTDIFLTELQRFLPIQVETFALLLEQFCNILAKVSDKILLKRLKESIFDHLLNLGHTVVRAKQEGQELDICMENLGSLALNVQIASVAFKLAALPSTPQLNRKVLYELNSEFSNLEKFLAFSGVTLSASSFKRQRNKPIDQSEDLGVSSQVVANGLVEDMGKRKVHSQKVKTGKRLDMGSEEIGRVEKIVTPDALMEEANKNLPPCQKVGVSQKKEQKKAFQAKQEKKESVIERVLFPEMELKISKGGVLGNTVGSADGSGLRILNGEDCLDPNDPVVSNLRTRFDSIAAGGSSDLDTCDSPSVPFPLVPFPKTTGTKKRKRGKSPVISPSHSDTSWSGQENGVSPCSLLVTGSGSVNNTSEKKKKKKVRFSLKNNLVWKPYCPLPPQILRVPPSATPRGSALKKGVPPGPIIIVKEASPKPRKGGMRRTPKSLKNLSRGPKSVSRCNLSP